MDEGLDWYKRRPRSFLDGVQGMGPEMIGAYAVLLDLIYARGGQSRRDDRHLAGILGCSLRKARALTDSLIERGKIEVEGDGLLFSQEYEPPQLRRPLPAHVRAEVLSRDGEACRYCGAAEGPLEIDHVFPVARGGTDDIDNLTVAYRPCNRSKGAKTVDQWRGPYV